MNCKKCGAELHPQANFCMSCGAKVEPEIACYACGAMLPESAAFCFRCGADLKAKREEAAEYDYDITDPGQWAKARAQGEIPDNAPITSIKVAEGITVCPSFWGMKNLRKVSLPSTLSEIPGRAFIMTGVERLDIPDGVTWIGSHAFEACKNLKHIHLSNNLQRISQFAFFDCKEDELCVEYRSHYMHASTCMHYLEEAGVDVEFD